MKGNIITVENFHKLHLFLVQIIFPFRAAYLFNTDILMLGNIESIVSSAIKKYIKIEIKTLASVYFMSQYDHNKYEKPTYGWMYTKKSLRMVKNHLSGNMCVHFH